MADDEVHLYVHIFNDSHKGQGGHTKSLISFFSLQAL